MTAVRRPDPQIVDQLIGENQAPPDNDLDLEVQAALAAEAREALLAQRTQTGGQPIETASLAENHSVTQTPQVEPGFLERIWEVVLAAFETFVGWVFSFVSWISGGRESSSVTSSPVSDSVSSTTAPAPLVSIAAPAAPVRDSAHFSKDLFLRVWNHFKNGGTDAEMGNLVTLSIQSERVDFPEIQEIPIELVTQADYRGIASLHLAAYTNQRHRMCGALLTKGEETHLLFVDARERDGDPISYLFSYPNQEVVQANTLHNFIVRVGERVPIDANLPFNLQRLVVIENQNQNQ